MFKVKALWDYSPGGDDEIGFRQGDILTLISAHNNDWWEGKINGERGLFPANRVEFLKSDGTSTVTVPKDLLMPDVQPGMENNSGESEKVYTEVTEEDNRARNSDGTVINEPPPVYSIRKEGFLGRRFSTGGILTLKSWKSMWVEQAFDLLYFFKVSQANKEDGKRDIPHDIVDLRNSKIDASGAYDKKKTVFTISLPNEEIVTLQASSEAEMIGWTNAMSEAQGAEKERLDELGPLASPKVKNRGLNRKLSINKKPASSTISTPNHSSNDDETFGGMLTNHVARESRSVPLVVEMCAVLIEQYGSQIESLYEMEYDQALFSQLKEQFNTDPTAIKFDGDKIDMGSMIEILKTYFRELKVPLLTFDLLDSWIKAGASSDLSKKANEIKKIIPRLPVPHKDTLIFLIAHLKRISRAKDMTGMSEKRLSEIFGPLLARSMDGIDANSQKKLNAVVETMLIKCTEIFMR